MSLKDVQEALLEFDKYTLVYIPSKEKCSNCKELFVITYREDWLKNSAVTKRYICDKCLRLEIFGL